MPELVTGISFMFLFAFLGVQKGQVTLILAHIAFCVPFAVLSINPKLRQLDKNLAEAAQDLGATQLQAITMVILPEIMPGIVSSISSPSRSRSTIIWSHL
jgi:spermidine/putrescine transport system permease protein